MDMEALNDLDAELSKKGESKDLFFSQKLITEETPIRLLPPLPHMNGIPYMKVIRWWIDKKPFISHSTFGKADVIQLAVDEALRTDPRTKKYVDPDAAELANDKERIKKSVEYWMPILLLEYKMKGKNVVDCKVEDGYAKILQCGPQLMKRINKVVTSRAAQNNTEDGICDRVKGMNILLSKTGKKMSTEYDASIGEAWEFDQKFYEDIPNMAEIAKSQIKLHKYLTAFARQYLFGEEIPDEVEAAEVERAKVQKEKYAEAMKEKERARDNEEEEPEDEPQPKKAASKKAPAPDEEEDPAPKKTAKKKPVDDDLPFDEDEEAKPAKKMATKKVIPDDDLDLEDDVDEKPVAKKSAPAKTTKKTVLDDLDDLDD